MKRDADQASEFEKAIARLHGRKDPEANFERACIVRDWARFNERHGLPIVAEVFRRQMIRLGIIPIPDEIA